MATRMILIRHGDTGYPDGMFVGRTDVDLKEGEKENARKLGERLKKEGIKAFYTSNMKRAVQTGEGLGKGLGMESSGSFDELREIDFGEDEMKWRDDFRKKHPGEHEKRVSDPWNYNGRGMESWSQVKERALPVITELFRKHKGETFAVVAHGVVNRVVLASLTGIDTQEAFQTKVGFLSALFFKKDGDKIEVEKVWSAKEDNEQ